MKKYIATFTIALALIVGLAQHIRSAPATNPTNYFPGLLITTNVPEGTASNVYVCIPVNALTNASHSEALITNDVRPLACSMLYAIKTYQDAVTNSADQFSSSTFYVYNNPRWLSETNRIIDWTVSEGQTFTITPVYAGQ